MEKQTFTQEKPTKPGWYWCRLEDVGTWEAITHVDHCPISGEMSVSWMTAPGQSDHMHVKNCDDRAYWLGPLEIPEYESNS